MDENLEEKVEEIKPKKKRRQGKRRKHRTQSQAEQIRWARGHKLTSIVHARLADRTYDLLQNMLDERDMSLRELIEEEIKNYYGYNVKLTIDGRKETAKMVQEFLRNCHITFEKSTGMFHFKNDDVGMRMTFSLPSQIYEKYFANGNTKDPLVSWKNGGGFGR